MFSLIVLAVLMLPFAIISGIACFWKSKRAWFFRRMLWSYLAAIPLLFFGFGPYWVAKRICRAHSRPMDMRLKETPATYGVQYEAITFQSADGLHLNGWWIPPSSKDAILIGTHGLFRTKVELLARTVDATKAGYGALLYDSRSHGTSDHGVVSLGCHEANDVLGAIRYVQHRYDGKPAPKIVLMGVSMGAVTTLLAAAQSSEYAAIIVDSPFSSLEETAVDHAWLFFKLPRYPFTPLFLFWYRQCSGCDPAWVDSNIAVKHLQPVPILFMGSAGDRRIGAEVARRLYQESDSSMKRIKIFGADVGHGAAYRLHPNDYSQALLDFMDQAISQKAPPTGDGFQ
ncbi:MAG: alpha/beta fold hydrolase [Terriglobia bacterium]